MEEIGRFPRTINKFKGKRFIEEKTITNKEKLQHGLDISKATLLQTKQKLHNAGTKFRGFQDKLQKTFPGVQDFNKKLEQEYTNKNKNLTKKNWWEY